MKATRKCSFCGKSFVTRSGMQRYCSEACQAEAKRARVMQKNNLFKVAQPLMEIQHQEYLTFSKAATLMGCSRQYVYKLVALGKLKASRISNRMAFIRRADIEQMLEGNPYHRILPGNTSTPRKSSSSSLPAKREKREKESEEVLDFYSGEEVDVLVCRKYHFACVAVDIGCGGGDAVFGFELNVACGIDLRTHLLGG